MTSPIYVPRDIPEEEKTKIRTAIELQRADMKVGEATRLILGRVLHPIKHYWVEYRRYDAASKRILTIPHARVCLFCNVGQMR